MNEDQEKQKIRDVIAAWMRASAEGDLERVLSLMAEDVVFLLPGQPPMRGRSAFAAASRSMPGQVRIEGKPDIQEIHIAGDYAFCWSYLSVTVTPSQAGPPSDARDIYYPCFAKSQMAAGFCFAMPTCSPRSKLSSLQGYI